MALRTLAVRVRLDDIFARELYGALCDVRWHHQGADTEPVSMTWRDAGDVVSQFARKGDYLDYYYSGNEGVVSARIRDALGALGWIPTRPDL